MHRLLKVSFVLMGLAGFITFCPAAGALAKDIKVGAVINLTGPAGTHIIFQ